MAEYNRAVTGSAFQFPYSLYQEQYFHHGVFLFGSDHQPTREPGERIAQFFRERSPTSLSRAELVGQATAYFVMRLPLAISVAFGFSLLTTATEPFRSMFIWPLLFLQVWGRHATRMLPVAFIALSSIELLVWSRDPSYLVLLVPALLLGLLTLLAALERPGRWMQLSLVTIIGTMGVQSLVAWWYPHYSAALLPLIIAMVATGMRRVSRRQGASLRRHLWKLMAVAMAAHLLGLGIARLNQDSRRPLQDGRYPHREAVAAHLESFEGRHLVMVSYAPDYPLDSEWVFNGADMDTSSVLFAHSLGEAKDAQLFRSIPSRHIWRLDVSLQGAQLNPYTR